jgi:hypothetical protein
MPPRKPSRALGLQRQDPGKELQAGRVDTPALFDDERHEVRLVAVRLRLLAFVHVFVPYLLVGSSILLFSLLLFILKELVKPHCLASLGGGCLASLGWSLGWGSLRSAGVLHSYSTIYATSRTRVLEYRYYSCTSY